MNLREFNCKDIYYIIKTFLIILITLNIFYNQSCSLLFEHISFRWSVVYWFMTVIFILVTNATTDL